MATPIYYLPGASTASPATLEDAGLGYLTERDRRCAYTGFSGPDGGRGVALCPPPGKGGRQGDPASAPLAKWHRLPGSRAWLGSVPGQPVEPADLARTEQHQGHWINLADGNRWLVPVARRVSGSPGLPRGLAWDGRDWSPGEVVARYRELWGSACEVWDRLACGASGELTITEEADLAVRALGVNYRLGPGEVSVLGLLDTRCEAEVVLALVDWPSVRVLAAGGA